MNTQVETHISPQSGKRNRLTTVIRPILIIPAIFLVGLITPSPGGSGALPLLIGLSLILFHTYPIWMVSFTHGMLEFTTKTNSYFFLLTDNYPNFNSNLDVRVLLPDVAEGKSVNRWLPLVKWLLAIPHYIVLAIATPGVYAIALVNWFVILFTGSYSGIGKNFTIGYISYLNRIAGYAFAMVTDSYPRIITK